MNGKAFFDRGLIEEGEAGYAGGGGAGRERDAPVKPSASMAYQIVDRDLGREILQAAAKARLDV